MPIANDVISPKKERSWKLEDNGNKIEDELIIAETFNKYFVDKITKLKQNIDPEFLMDPLEKLQKATVFLCQKLMLMMQQISGTLPLGK